MKDRWAQLGAKLGIGYCVAGMFLVFLGWNGAASYYEVPAQFPYLISGGIAGLCLVIIGAAILVAQRAREDRVSLETTINELRAAIERISVGSTGGDRTEHSAPIRPDVMAGPHSYHRPDCSVIEGQLDVTRMTAAAAKASGRNQCRICQPDVAVA